MLAKSYKNDIKKTLKIWTVYLKNTYLCNVLINK